MDFYVDPSLLVNHAVNWVNVAPFEPEKSGRGLSNTRTEFSATKIGVRDFFASETGARAPTPAPSLQATIISGSTATLKESAAMQTQVSSSQGESDLDRIAKQRVRLLAVKFASDTASSELLARLEILNHRLLSHSPRVSSDQVAALESAAEVLADIRAGREELSKRLGIHV